jgi:hypothetical protein
MSFASCGICKFTDEDNVRNCTICLNHLCGGAQKSPSTVCFNCRQKAEQGNYLHKIYVDGKDKSGCWIDPASKCPIPTCQICGMPSSDFFCDKLSLMIGNKCVRTGLTLSEYNAQKNVD